MSEGLLPKHSPVPLVRPLAFEEGTQSIRPPHALVLAFALALACNVGAQPSLAGGSSAVTLRIGSVHQTTELQLAND